MNRSKEREITKASLELLFEIHRELSSSLDLHEVLQRVVQLSMKSMGAINGSLIVLDEQGRPVDSIIITGERYHENTTHQLKTTLEGGLAGWVARNKQAALVPDTSQDERWLRRPDDALDRSGPKSAASAPVLAHGRLVGVLTLVHPKPGFFQPDHLALLQAIAGEAGTAVLNSRLYRESQRKARIMTALAESAGVITASLDVEEVLQRILEQTGRALQVETVFLAMIDPLTQEFVLRACSDMEQVRISGTRLGRGRGIAGWVAQEGRGVVVPDISRDMRFSPAIDNPSGWPARAVACAPVRSRGQVTGVLEAINPLAGDFEPEALLILTGIGSLAGTAIRHAQLFEQLQSSRQRYRDLFEDSLNPILITGWDGAILEGNRLAESLTGLDRERLRSLPIEQLGMVQPEVLGAGFENLASGSTLAYEAFLKCPGEHTIPLQVNARRLLIEGTPYIQWILQDITAQKDLDRLREDLFSMIYHDLRSPLSNVLSGLNMIESLVPGEDATLKPVIQIASRSALRVQRLTHSLLDIRRLEAGQPVGGRHPVPVASLVKEAVDSVAYAIEGRGQEICLSLVPGLPEVYVDSDMVQRVFINLLENASKYSPQGSKILCSAQVAGEWLEVGIQDNGLGIPPQDLERIFDKFTRLDTPQGVKGLGLGLAFCRLAVEGHGGRIWVEPEPQTGAHFRLTLPVWWGKESLPDAL